MTVVVAFDLGCHVASFNLLRDCCHADDGQ